jgi:hypothetical protein
LPQTVAAAARQLLQTSVAARQQHVMEQVLVPLERNLNHVLDVLEETRCSMQDMCARLPTSKTNGTFLERILWQTIDSGIRGLVLDAPHSMRVALEQDTGAGGSTRVRVGRFPLFIEAVVAAASVGLEEQIALVEDAVHVKIKQLVEAHVRPVLELPSATMSVGIADRKKLVDAMIFAVFQEVNEVNALKALPTCLNFEAVAESMEVWVETHADVSSVWLFLLNDVSFLDAFPRSFIANAHVCLSFWCSCVVVLMCMFVLCSVFVLFAFTCFRNAIKSSRNWRLWKR